MVVATHPSTRFLEATPEMSELPTPPETTATPELSEPPPDMTARLLPTTTPEPQELPTLLPIDPTPM